GDVRLQSSTAAPGAVGHPQRNRRLPDPRLEADAARSHVEAGQQVITLHWLYALAGAMFAAFSLLSAFDRSNPKRFGNAAFWGLMALSLLGGDYLGDFANGLLVLGLAGLAGFGFLGRSHPPTSSDDQRAA